MLLLNLFLTLLAASAAEPRQPVPRPIEGVIERFDQGPAAIARWVSDDGRLETQRGVSITTKWTWVDRPEERKTPLDPANPWISRGEPALDVEITTRAIPREWGFAKAHGDNATLIEVDRVKGPDPRMRRVVARVRAQISYLDLEFVEDRKPRHLSLALTVPENLAHLAVHRSCGEFNVRATRVGNLVRDTPPSRHLYLGLSCMEDDFFLYFHFVRSPDSIWNFKNVDDEHSRDPTLVFKVAKGDRTLFFGNTLTKVQTRDSADRVGEYELYCARSSGWCHPGAYEGQDP